MRRKEGLRIPDVGGAATRFGWQEDLQLYTRRAAAGIYGGLVCGALVGGIGGRLAMLFLRVTSDPAVRGVETDDGFVIGEVSFDTGSLVFFSAGMGADRKSVV